jgi:phage baseplate assembly protein W
MHFDHPYRIDGRGRTAETASEHEYARDLIDAVLFTAPGERVNRGDFGSGILQLVFDTSSEALQTATEFIVRSSLQRWLADVIVVDALEVERNEGVLQITLTYGLRSTDERFTDTFEREI